MERANKFINIPTKRIQYYLLEQGTEMVITEVLFA